MCNKGGVTRYSKLADLNSTSKTLYKYVSFTKIENLNSLILGIHHAKLHTCCCQLQKLNIVICDVHPLFHALIACLEELKSGGKRLFEEFWDTFDTNNSFKGVC